VLTDPATVAFALLGPLADVDFAFGAHSGPTHSVGATLIVLLAATVWPRPDVRRGCACAAAYASHILFDWMGNDTTPPIGVMALWPFSQEFYQSNLFVFEAISRRYWLPNFWTHNGLALARELVILLPLAALMAWRHFSRRPGS
jgi:inner membrane protein